MKEKQTLTTGEVAKYCGVNFRTVIRWIERGHLKAYKLPGRGDNRIPLESFIDFLTDNNIPVPADLLATTRLVLMLCPAPEHTALASLIRKQGFEPLLVPDPLTFGYQIAARAPAVIVIASPELLSSIDKLLANQERKPSLLLCLERPKTIGNHDASWQFIDWPLQQAKLVSLLEAL